MTTDRTNGTRRGRGAMWCMLAVASALTVAPASAQVTFAGTVKLLGGDYKTFNNPNGVAIDSNGNVFVADCGNNVVKEFAAVNGALPDAPTVSLSLNTAVCPEGVALDSKNNLYVASAGSTAIQEFLWQNNGYSTPPAMVGSTFSGPTGVTVDSKGNVYVADRGNRAVKEIVATNGSVSSTSQTVAIGPTGGASYFASPSGIAVDGSGNLFVVSGPTCLVELNAVNGSVPTNIQPPLCLGTTVPGHPGSFSQLFGVAIDGSGNLYVTDLVTGAGQVKKVVLTGGAGITVTEVVSGIRDKSLINPAGVAVDSHGNLAVVDAYTNIAGVFNMTSPVDFGTVALGSPGKPASLSFVYFNANPEGPITVLTGNTPSLDFFDITSGVCRPMSGVGAYRGNTCTVDMVFKPAQFGQRSGSLQLMDNNNAPLASVPLTGMGALLESTVGGAFDHPEGIAVDNSGSIYVSDTVDRKITAMDPTGAIGEVAGYVPFGSVAVDKNGNIFFADTRNNVLKEIVAGSLTATPIATGFSAPHGVAVDSKGNVFIADSNNHVVKEATFSGGAWTVTTVASQLVFPTSVALDTAGDLFVADPTANKVISYPVFPSGGFYPGNPVIGNFNAPWGVAVDATGNLFVADSGNNQVKEFLAPGYNGAIALASDFNHPMAVAVDANENVYVADTNNSRVVKLVISVAAGVP